MSIGDIRQKLDPDNCLLYNETCTELSKSIQMQI